MGKLTNHEIYIRNWTEFAVSFASLIATLLQLLTIFRMRSWNGYILLICSMCFFQILYDVNFLLGVAPGFSACMTWNFLDVLGGLAVSFWTNCISFVIMVTVVQVKSFNVFNNYWKFLVYSVVLPFIVAIMTMLVIVPAGQDDDKPFSYCAFNNSSLSNTIAGIYYWGRIVAIIINAAVFVFISFRISSMHLKFSITKMSEASGDTLQRRPDSGVEQQNLAIATLVSRLKYYPIAQVLSRSGALWNGFDNYRYSNFSSSMMNAITGPSLGVMCFAIFLVMQPKARDTFFTMFGLSRSFPKPAETRSSIFRGSYHHYTEEDLDHIINEDGLQDLETIDNIIHSSASNSIRNTQHPSDISM